MKIIKATSPPKIKTFYEEKPIVVKVSSNLSLELNQSHIDKMVKLAIETLDGVKSFFSREDNVVVKPNMACSYPKDVKGLTTDVRVISSIIKWLKKNHIKNIIIAESTSINLPTSSRYMFEKTGLKDIAEEHHVPLIDLKKDDFVEFEVQNNKILKNIRVARTIYDCDALIDVAVFKGYPFTQCCKNMMGVIPDKDRPELMHPNLPIAVPELAMAVRPTLCVVDGIYGAFFHAGNKIRELRDRKFNIILASKDPLSVDALGAQIWGYKLSQVELLNFDYAEKIGLGRKEFELKQIDF